jgi:uncharacterized surface protein with fasciclin (FAS1) repeats
MKFLLKTFFIVITTAVLVACDDNDDTSSSTEPTQNITEIAAGSANLTTLVTALQAAGLDTVLADENRTFTVFAPTDEAFNELGATTINDLLADIPTLTDILLYHVITDAEVDANAAIAAVGTKVNMGNMEDIAVSLSGNDLYVNRSEVTENNIFATNGVIHIVDKVLLPLADAPAPTNNIVETAIAAGNFTTLVTALQTAGLDTTLSDANSQFTVFAPTDDAFALLGQQAINDLLADVPTLTNVLLKHVVAGSVDSVTAFTLNGTDVTTLNPQTVALDIIDGELFVDDSRVTTFDINTTNGIIHVIDAVIPLD